MLADAAGIGAASVHGIWKAHRLALYRFRTFKLSNDADFVDKLRDFVGLYVNPPDHAIALSVDEKSQIQALDSTQPDLPIKSGRLGTLADNCKRNDMTALFAFLNVLNGSVIGRGMQRHRHQGFICFSTLLQRFFVEHLGHQRAVSPHSIAAYRDTFRLLLSFAEGRIGKAPTALALVDLDARLILSFLDHLEQENKIREAQAA